MVLFLILAAWALVVILVLGLCLAARRGDVAQWPAAERAQVPTGAIAVEARHLGLAASRDELAALEGRAGPPARISTAA